MENDSIIKPTVHINGTDAGTLCTNLEHAIRQLRNSLVALGDCSPHPRDYYPQVSFIARTQHDNRVLSVQRTLDELIEIHECITNQQHQRDRRKK